MRMLGRGQTPSSNWAVSLVLDREQPLEPVKQWLDAYKFWQLDRKPKDIEIIGALEIGFVICYFVLQWLCIELWDILLRLGLYNTDICYLGMV